MAQALNDLSGKRFGLLLVLRRDKSPPENTGAYWVCACDCGSEKSIRGSNLSKGDIRSCGCLRRTLVKDRLTKHGFAQRGRKTPEYRVWCQMIGRCHSKTNRSFCNYGARGIVVCEEWRSDFAGFLRDMGTRPSPQHTLERMNNDGNYEPNNCRWATRTEQNRNTRSNVVLLLDGEQMPLSVAAERCGLAYSAVQARLRDQALPLHAALGLNLSRTVEWIKEPKRLPPSGIRPERRQSKKREKGTDPRRGRREVAP
jgi:hypothetical protein